MATTQESGMDVVNCESEKIEIGLEVLADIKNMLKNELPQVENAIVHFQKGDGKKEDVVCLGNGKKEDVVYLGNGKNLKETYAYFASQILNILVREMPSYKEDGLQNDESGNDEISLEEYKKRFFESYLKKIFSRGWL